jgi:hypothetical protein
LDDESLSEAWIQFICSTLGDRGGIFHDSNDVVALKRQWPSPPHVDSNVFSLYLFICVYLISLTLFFQCTLEDARVVECGDSDFYHAMLMKVDIAKNNNSFYLMQLLQKGFENN